jgi:hypothetical protein
MQYDIDGGNITVIVGEEARLDVPTALNYIKSGQAEIGETVDAGIDAFDLNAANKTTAYDNNASAKLAAYNDNATDKTNAFNLNASGKTGDFNDNYTLKKAAVDASADAAAASATLAEQWATKMDGSVDGTEYSAKYYADLASQEVGATGANKDLSNLTPTGEAKFTAKQDVINDLSDIRAGAALGATAVQPATLASYVTTNTAQTITGAKTFSDNLVKQSNSLDYKGIHIQNTQLTKGTTPSSTAGGQFMFQSKDGLNLANRIGGVEIEYNTAGNVQTKLTACQPVANSTTYAAISVFYPTSGNPYTYAPTPTDTTTTSGTQIATTGWVNSVGNNVMHLTDYENITGYKSFQTNIEFDSPNMTQGTNGSGYGIEFYDKNSNRFGFLRPQAQTNANVLSLCATRIVNGQIAYSAVDATVDSSGNCYVIAPNSDVNRSIVTTVNKSKAANGYFQLGNGLIIQWGKSTTTNSEAKITLPKAFTTTNYAVVGNSTQALGNASNRYLTGWAQVIARTTTNFTMYMSNFENSYWWNDVEKPFTWIAIGY